MEDEVEFTDSIISIVGGAYLQPIADLVERLRALSPRQGVDDVHVGRFENGYAAAVCLLSVVTLESFLMRVCQIKQQGPGLSPVALFQSLYRSYQPDGVLAEVYIVRNVLAHNHVWQIDYSWGEDGTIERHRGAPLIGHFRKTNYEQHVDVDVQRTKRLRLHVVPSRVDRRDAALVLKTVWKALEVMDRDDHTACPVSPAFVRIGSSSIPFAELVQRFCDGIA